jgi:Protein of unknwon function (DUF3310)
MTATKFEPLEGAAQHCAHCGYHITKHPSCDNYCPVDSFLATPPKGKLGISPLDVQVAGGHYKTKRIQPVEYIAANNLNFLEGCIVKRITRWRDKSATDRFEDLQKIKHEVDLLIEMEKRYGGEA